MTRLRLGIVGGGIGGLALAAALRDDYDITVFEQAEKLARIGAGIHVAPNAIKVLTQLGVSRRWLDDHAFCPPSMRFRDGTTGELLNELQLGSEFEREHGAPYACLHRGDMQAKLVDIVPSGVLRRGAKVVGIDTVGDEVTLQLAGGSRHNFDVVVAADGVHSGIRRQLFGVEHPEFTGRVATRTVVPSNELSHVPLDPSCKWWGSDRHFVHYFVGRGRELVFTNSVVDPHWDVESWTAEGDPADLVRAFESFAEPVRAMVQSATTVNRWAIHDRAPLEHWCDGSVALLGDACHTMPPYRGQGAAMALEDAAVLSRTLQQVATDREMIPRALQAYEHARKDRTARMRLESRSNSWGGSTDNTDVESQWVFDYDAWTVSLQAL